MTRDLSDVGKDDGRLSSTGSELELDVPSRSSSNPNNPDPSTQPPSSHLKTWTTLDPALLLPVGVNLRDLGLVIDTTGTIETSVRPFSLSSPHLVFSRAHIPILLGARDVVQALDGLRIDVTSLEET